MNPNWEPIEDELIQATHLLLALSQPSRNDHPLAVATVNQNADNIQFAISLLQLFVHGSKYDCIGLTLELRQIAGIIIKNYICPKLVVFSINIRQRIQYEILQALSDTDAVIQNGAANLYGTLARLPTENFSEIVLKPLLDHLNISTQPLHTIYGVMKAIKIIAEDSSDILCHIQNIHAFQHICWTYIQLLSHTDTFIKVTSLHTLNHLLSNMPVIDSQDLQTVATSSSSVTNCSIVFYQMLPTYMNAISSLAHDIDKDIRAAVCHSVLLCTTTYNDTPQYTELFPSICTFMLHTLNDPEEVVALETCEFWSMLIEESKYHPVIIQYLHQLIPLLLSRLKLTEIQLLQEQTDAEAEASGEKRLNFKPIHHRVGYGRGDNEEDDEDDVSKQWTVRKHAALLLDTLGVHMSATLILPIALPVIESYLKSEDVWTRESAMLGLGAFSKGYMQEMYSYLPQLFPYFLQNIEDNTVEIRCISCWVLSRYCSWIFDASNESGLTHFHSSLSTLCNRLLDPNPKVQSAVVCALCRLAEEAGDELIPFLPHVFPMLHQCLNVYGVKATMHVIDLIGIIADSVGTCLADPSLTSLYLPKLMSLLSQVRDDDMYIFPLLECLTALTPAIGTEIGTYAPELITRCLRIAHQTMIANQNSTIKKNDVTFDGSYDENENDNYVDENYIDDDAPVKDFAICSVDVLTGLCEGLQDHFITLIQPIHTEPLLSLIFICLQDPLPELRQSIISLVGEISKSASNLFASIDIQCKLLDLLVGQLNDDYPAVCNNTLWALGEMTVHYGGQVMAPYIGRITSQSVSIMYKSDISESMQQNLGITLGRLAATNTDVMTDILWECFDAFCACLQSAPYTEERVHGFTGLVAIIHSRPAMLLDPTQDHVQDHIRAFITVCSSWEDPPEDPLLTQLSEILKQLQERYTTEWKNLLKCLDTESRSHLTYMFKLK